MKIFEGMETDIIISNKRLDFWSWLFCKNASKFYDFFVDTIYMILPGQLESQDIYSYRHWKEVFH